MRNTIRNPLPHHQPQIRVGYTNNLCFQPLSRQSKDRSRKIPPNLLLYVPSSASRDLAKDLDAACIPKEAAGGKVDFHYQVGITVQVLKGEIGWISVEAVQPSVVCLSSVTFGVWPTFAVT